MSHLILKVGSYFHCNRDWPFLLFHPAPGPGHESTIRRPQLRVHIQRFSFPFSGQLWAHRLAHANVFSIAKPQLPKSHPGRLLPRWRHNIHRLRLTSTDWQHRSHLQHQHWWVSTHNTPLHTTLPTRWTPGGPFLQIMYSYVSFVHGKMPLSSLTHSYIFTLLIYIFDLIFDYYYYFFSFYHTLALGANPFLQHTPPQFCQC